MFAPAGGFFGTPGVGQSDIRIAYVLKAEYEHRRNVSVEALKEIEGIKFGIPEGAFYITAQLPVDNAEKFLIF